MSVAEQVAANQATERAGVEAAFSLYSIGIESALRAKLMKKEDVSQQLANLETAYGIIMAGRRSFSALGIADSPQLLASRQQADANYLRVKRELTAA